MCAVSIAVIAIRKTVTSRRNVVERWRIVRYAAAAAMSLLSIALTPQCHRVFWLAIYRAYRSAALGRHGPCRPQMDCIVVWYVCSAGVRCNRRQDRTAWSSVSVDGFAVLLGHSCVDQL